MGCDCTSGHMLHGVSASAGVFIRALFCLCVCKCECECARELKQLCITGSMCNRLHLYMST